MASNVASNEIVHDCHSFKIVSILGQGKQSNVYLIEYQDGCLAVLKEQRHQLYESIPMKTAVTTEIDKKLENESAILHYLNTDDSCDPAIVTLYTVLDETNDFCIIEEYIQGITLEEFVKQRQIQKLELSENEIVCLLKQLIRAIAYLHTMEVAHRDIKLANVMIIKTEWHGQQNQEQLLIKLIDFGFACSTLIGNFSWSFKGTPYYMSPELWKLRKDKDIDMNISMTNTVPSSQSLGTNESAKLNSSMFSDYAMSLYKAADVYACGIVGYYLLHQGMPYNASHSDELERLTLSNSEIKCSSNCKVSCELKQIIESMLIKDFRVRPSMMEIAQRFRHIKI